MKGTVQVFICTAVLLGHGTDDCYDDGGGCGVLPTEYRLDDTGVSSLAAGLGRIFFKRHATCHHSPHYQCYPIEEQGPILCLHELPKQGWV